MSDYRTTSSPYHSKRQYGGKGSANNLGLRKYEATTEYSFDNAPDEDEEFDRYVLFVSFTTLIVALIDDCMSLLIFFDRNFHFDSYEIQWLQYLNEWDKLGEKVCLRIQ
jgi:hypothetical protein